jgi:diguanylate cyclase (GGDEF)-like protein
MLELLAWPLLPFLGYWVGTWGRRDESAAGWAVALGVAAGGVGWTSGWFARVPVEPWISAGFSWLISSGYVLQRGKKGRLAKDETAELSRLKERAAELEREHAALRNDLQKSEREEARAFQIYALAKSLTESLSWDSMVNRFSQVLQQVTGSTDFLLYFTSWPSGEPELKLKSGVWPKESLPSAAPGPHPRWLPYGNSTLLQVPLRQGEELMGVLWIRWSDDSRPSVAEIEPVFEHLLIGFQKASLFARMESLSRLDGLTGVLRRQNFLEHVDAEWKRARAFRTTFSLMLVDADHFKKINDRHGHPVGDTVLARLGEILKQGVYETDAVGRYGGEEFAVLLSRSEPECVRRKADILRERMAGEDFQAGAERFKATISIGLAHFPRDGHTVEQLLEAADRALYAAKELGRNRVVDFQEIK